MSDREAFIKCVVKHTNYSVDNKQIQLIWETAQKDAFEQLKIKIDSLAHTDYYPPQIIEIIEDFQNEKGI